LAIRREARWLPPPYSVRNEGPYFVVTGSCCIGVSNIYFFTESLDYFSGSAKLNLRTHTWSLGVEEQLYLAFPALGSGNTIFSNWGGGFSLASPTLDPWHLLLTRPHFGAWTKMSK